MRSLLDSVIAKIEPTVSPRERHRFPDRRGEYWAPCPFGYHQHGGAFSFSERGYLCFGCGAHGSLQSLAKHLNVDGIMPERLLVRPSPKLTIQRPWQSWSKDELTRHYGSFGPFANLPAVAQRAILKRGINPQTAERWGLGYGVLPSSKCRHHRIILPVFESGKLVALRGRQIDCDCDPKKDKWLCSAGSSAALFGAEMLKPGRHVIIVGGPFDAILAMQEAPEIVAVASTGGEMCWRGQWTQLLFDAKPSSVIVWLDNEDGPRKKAVEIANELLGVKLRAQVYHWPADAPDHADVADLVVGG